MRLALALLALVVFAAAVWLLLAPTDGDVAPIQRGMTQVRAGEAPADLTDVLPAPDQIEEERLPVPSEVEVSKDPEDPDESDDRPKDLASVWRWMLYFDVTSPTGVLPDELGIEEPGGSRRSARLDPTTGRFKGQVLATRDEILEAGIVISSGRGAAARRSVIVMGSDRNPDTAANLTLDNATWDPERGTIVAGTVHLEAPPRLGRLILQPGGVGGVVFEITSNGTKGPLKTRVEFPEGSDTRKAADELELATFLPASEWTAKWVSGDALRSNPDWKATALAGEDLMVDLTDTGGVRISLSSLHLRSFETISIVRLPSPLQERMTGEELTARTLAQGTPTVTIGFGGAGFDDLPDLHGFYIGARQAFLDPGDYRIEAWGDEDAAGVRRLLTSSLATVHDQFVEVLLR
ncbi:hypothetical protein Poly30_47020 [Planctomycetes bacterium Poly30]|uniref:Uncharacterized protein n=1 Tax=Saltatorellus ferox TaxID=2528018 RepID=A0A518EYH2_9BACT|nr:hypothetical protein Poly30_47020 [Planctomycetes bacterium Poly30]